VISATVNGEVWDLMRPISSDVTKTPKPQNPKYAQTTIVDI